ncbi:MAG TPA: hypothetical protein VK670_13420, partial [Silvibacterium sp.]|nr:hypothetical protein [Silvibacterium sp.]
MRRESAGARSDLEDTEPTPLRQLAGGLLNCGGYGGKPVAGEEAFTIKLIQQIRSRTPKQNLYSILLAAQYRAESRTVSRTKQTFGEMAG